MIPQHKRYDYSPIVDRPVYDWPGSRDCTDVPTVDLAPDRTHTVYVASVDTA